MGELTVYLFISTVAIMVIAVIVGKDLRDLLFDIRDELKKMNEREK